MNQQKTISFDQKLWSKIDKSKGEVARSRYLANILADYFAISKKPGGGKS